MEALSINRKGTRKQRSGAKQASAAKFGGRNSFLNTRLLPIKACNVYGYPTLIDDTSFAHLCWVFEHFMKERMGDDYERQTIEGKDNDIKAMAMLSKMRDLAFNGEQIEMVRIPDAEYGFDFFLYKESDYDVWTFNIMPVNILQRTQGELRDLLLHFFAYMWLFSPYEVFTRVEGLSEYVFDVECMDGDSPVLNDEEDDNFDDDFKELRRRYYEGDIRELMNEILSTANDIRCNPQDNLLWDKIDACRKFEEETYTTASNTVRKIKDLLDAMDDGVTLNSKDSNIMLHTVLYIQGDIGEDFDDYDDDDWFDFKTLFVFAYGDTESDMAMKSSFDFLNNSGEASPQPLINYLVLGETGQTSIERDYPREWQIWNNKMFNLIDE